jgi:hypothetical protein
MAVLQKKKVLFISHEFAPYNEETEFAKNIKHACS